MPCERTTLVPSSDGLAGRCVGPWSRDKLFYIRAYLELFSEAMKNKFPESAYIDLFAGPGHCVLDDDSGSIDGSPLVALSVPVRFSAYYFVEHNLDAMAALQTRVSRIAPEARVKYYPRDANVVISDLVKDLPRSSLDVAVVDQTGLHFRFESLQVLTQNRKVDLIYLFPEGMDIKRNLERYLDQCDSPLDKALGTGEWRFRTLAQALKSELPEEEHWEQIGHPIVEVFRKQLHSIGYVEVTRVGDRRTQSAEYPIVLSGFCIEAPIGPQILGRHSEGRSDRTDRNAAF